MSRPDSIGWVVGASVIGLSLHGIASEQASAPGSEIEWVAQNYFRTQVQPLLQAHCFECHSHGAGDAKGGLYLDSRSGWEAGGHSGAVVVPGDPEASLLIRAVRGGDPDLRMPPKGTPLLPGQVDILVNWVKLGAIDPRIAAEPEPGINSTHWAFQPIVRPSLPEVKQAEWVRTPVDSFVLRQLENRGMSPSRRADQVTLLRRLHFDLVGLPPTLDEVLRFRANRSPSAYAQTVDELLASPQYGERWGRHWLDVARYADTKGYVFQQERRFPYSYTYRDYVIESFNQDLPYDQFLKEQLAADHFQGTGEPRGLAGLGFLTLGRRFLNNQHDIIDDRIDVVTRGLMGLTVSCARCHDHKFDPIPTADYYSLYGVFASSEEPRERPLLAFDAASPAYLQFKKELDEATREWNNYRISNQESALAQARAKTSEYLMVVHDAKGRNRSETENLVKERKLGPVIAFRWQRYLEGCSAEDPVFSPWLAVSRGADSDGSVKEALERFQSDEGIGETLHPVLRDQLLESRPSTVAELAEVYGELFRGVEKEWHARGPDQSRLNDPDRESLRQIIMGKAAPASIPLDQATQLLEVRVQERIRALKRTVDRLPAIHPGAPARAMSLVDRRSLVEPVVFLRGKPGSRGPKVPRQFLALIEGEERVPFRKGSGRLELAEAITSPRNPLTSRVIVNRVWRHHFGTPLVETPSDFGVRASPPSHPELLDFLAADLIQEGWSLKRLHRMILLSSAYQQASDSDAWNSGVDPENRYLWRMNRRRLELEPLRDTLLAVSGMLDERIGGQPVNITEESSSPRRTVYGFIERQNLPGLFRTFDLASPDSSSAGRFETTVPQQALFMVNSSFVQGLARQLEASIQRRGLNSDAERLVALFQQVLQRNPTRREQTLFTQFLEADFDSAPDSIRSWRYGIGVEETIGAGRRFQAFSSFEGKRWRMRSEASESGTSLSARGGRFEEGDPSPLITRWVAPYASEFSIDLRLKPENGSEGMRVRLEASQGRLLREGEVPVEGSLDWAAASHLIRGEGFDLIVERPDPSESASFSWEIKIRSADSPNLSDHRYWSYAEDYSGPTEPPEPLPPLAQAAQVLMLSNELIFVD